MSFPAAIKPVLYLPFFPVSAMTKYGGTVIHSRRDAAGLIEVVETHGVRALHFGSEARQSAMALATPERLEFPYLRAMLIALVFVAEPRRILVLGLGGGSLVRFLLRHYPGVRIEVVESRTAVVDVAREYFGLPEQPGLRVRIGDGGEHLQRLMRQGAPEFDLILIDIFDDEGLAPVVPRHDFFAAVLSLLAAHGAVCINLWSSHEESFRAVMRLIKLYFPGNAFSLPVPGRGNVIGMGLQREIACPRLKDCLPVAQRLEQGLGIEFPRLLSRLAPPLPR
jgi:spermidine synthase